MGKPHLLIHGKEDNVGVVVVEGLTKGTSMLCVVTSDDSEFEMTANQDVPIGHKVALSDMPEGESVIKYGEDIGKVVANIKQGEHVHVHNIKTRRW